MKSLLAIGVALAAFTSMATAQPAPAPEPVTTEHYYRIKWGSAAEFKRLYQRNHAPILAEMQKQGFITAIRTEEPFTHMAGNQRWDLRVTISFREASSAVVAGGTFDKASQAVVARLYPDKKKFDAEEATRFSLLEEHWDVIVAPAE